MVDLVLVAGFTAKKVETHLIALRACEFQRTVCLLEPILKPLDAVHESVFVVLKTATHSDVQAPSQRHQARSFQLGARSMMDSLRGHGRTRAADESTFLLSRSTGLLSNMEGPTTAGGSLAQCRRSWSRRVARE
jgi:hypothetical protein